MPMASTTATLPSYDLLGVRVSAVSMAMAVDAIDTWIRPRDEAQESDEALPGRYVCITGVHGVMESQRDPDLREIHNNAAMVTPDGMPLVWLGWRAGQKHMTRVYGPDLLLEVCGVSAERGYRHFFFGGGDGVADLLASRLRNRFPGLDVVGTHCPPFRPQTEAEQAAVADEISASDADIVWVGLSTPKQERWMAEMAPRLPGKVMIGVGAAFDFHAGLKPQAPKWMQRSGLEWLFRLSSEPRRLARRYLKNNTLFVLRLLANNFHVVR